MYLHNIALRLCRTYTPIERYLYEHSMTLMTAVDEFVKKMVACMYQVLAVRVTLL